MTLALGNLCAYDSYTMKAPAVLRKVLDAIPASTLQLAHEAGVSEGLLRAVRDGRRRLTRRTRDRLVAALRTWGRRCDELADLLETATVEEEEDG
jgi:hypothetical protein